MMISGWLMLPDDNHADCVKLELGTLRIENGVISEIELGDPIFSPELGGPDTIVCPGFVDAHTHLPQFACLGADGMPLLEWLNTVVFPAESSWENTDVARQATENAIQQMIRNGTTAFAAYATVHHDATRAAIRVAHDAGVRAIIGQVLMDREAPANLIREPHAQLEEVHSLRGVGRVEHAVTPRFAITCTPELLHGAGRVVEELGCAVQTHLSETQDECAKVAEQFGGTAYTKVYDDAGLLTDRSVLGHGIWLSEEEQTVIAQRDSVIAHCPTANLFLGSGSMSRCAHKSAGIRSALGSDIGGGPDRSMVRVARAMLETARWRGDTPPSARECWHQITKGNAVALAFEDAGILRVGAPADLVLIEPDIQIPTGLTDPRDPLAVLLYAWDDRWIRRTLVQGRVTYSAPGA